MLGAKDAIMQMPSSVGSWIYLIIGIVGIVLSLAQIDRGISTGVFSYNSIKFGFSFVGFPAFVFQICQLALSAMAAFFGYSGIKNRERGGA